MNCSPKRWDSSDPETGYKEFRTSEKILEILKTVPGVSIKTGVAETGIVATLASEKKGACVAFRADMDALHLQENNPDLSYASNNEGVMHACGHDGHTACLLGTLLALSTMQEQLTSPVKFIFQPAEEGLAGAKKMCEEGVLKKPEVALLSAFHSFPTSRLKFGEIGIPKEAATASSSYFSIMIKGKGGHASAPRLSKDPIFIGSQLIVALQSIVSRSTNPLHGLVVSVTKFHSGTARNIIPDTALLEGTIRALKPELQKLAGDKIKSISKNIAAAFDAEVDVEVQDTYPVLINHAESVKRFAASALNVLPEKSVKQNFDPMLAAEDFAFFAQKVPSVFWFLGMNEETGKTIPGLHNSAFDFNDHAIPIAVELNCQTALDFQTASE